MRLMVFFDLPVKTAAQRKQYRLFRHFLLQDGYDMLQYSVYSRIVNGSDQLKKHQSRLQRHLPPDGAIRALHVSESQYSGMKLLLGSKSFQEKTVTDVQMVLF